MHYELCLPLPWAESSNSFYLATCIQFSSNTRISWILRTILGRWKRDRYLSLYFKNLFQNTGNSFQTGNTGSGQTFSYRDYIWFYIWFVIVSPGPERYNSQPVGLLFLAPTPTPSFSLNGLWPTFYRASQLNGEKGSR